MFTVMLSTFICIALMAGLIATIIATLADRRGQIVAVLRPAPVTSRPVTQRRAVSRPARLALACA